MRVNKEGNGPELPKYCDGTVTKLIMGWMGHKMNAAAGHHEESWARKPSKAWGVGVGRQAGRVRVSFTFFWRVPTP